MKIKFDEYSMWVQKKYDYDWYEWCVFVDADAQTLSRIESVEYTLHPSFPDPMRLIKNRANCFALYSSGWGGFALGVSITFADGTKDETSYFLKLLNKWPRGVSPPQQPGDADRQSVYQTLLHEKYRWRKMSTIVSKSKLTETRASEVLRELEAEGFARKSYFQSMDNQEMWGATAVVGMAPRPT